MNEIKYKKIAETIEGRIQAGEYAGQLPGIAKLAREYQTTHITISKSLKSLSAKGIVSIVRNRGVFVAAPSRRTPKSHIIGLIKGRVDLEYDHISETEKALLKQAEKHGFYMPVLRIDVEQYNYNHALFTNLSFDGFVFIFSSLRDTIIKELRDNGKPFIALNTIEFDDGVDFVDYDHEDALTVALEHLLELGHRRVAYLGSRNPSQRYEEQMLKVYTDIMKKAKCFDPSLFVLSSLSLKKQESNSWRYGNGAEYTEFLLNFNEPPTAIICTDYEMARGISVRLEERNLRVPHDISILVIDGKENLKTDDSFTALEAPVDKRAEKAFKRLLAMIQSNTNSLPLHELLPMRFVPRKSTSAPVINT